MRSAEEALASISAKLDMLIRVAAMSQIDGLTLKETVAKLGGIGFDAKEISAISGRKLTSVAPELSRWKAEQPKT